MALPDQARSVLSSSDYLSDDDILRLFPKLSRAELRRARKANPPLIEFYAFPRRAGGACCTVQQVQDYIDRTYKRVCPCQSEQAILPKASDSRSGSTISTNLTPSEAEAGTPAGMTADLAQHVADRFAQQIRTKPRSGSRLSSPRPRKARGEARLKLVKS